MGLKPYQPHRKEFLINTEWGTAKDAVSKEEAKNRGLVIFKGRWVTKEERTVLKDEYHAYHSIRQIAWLLICLSALILVPIVLYFPAAARSAGGINGEIASYIFFFIAGSAGLISGIGLLKYRRWARNLAAFVLLIPFPLGLIGAYYLFRTTAWRIFDGTGINKKSPFSPFGCLSISIVLLLLAVLLGIFIGWPQMRIRTAREHIALALSHIEAAQTAKKAGDAKIFQEELKHAEDELGAVRLIDVYDKLHARAVELEGDIAIEKGDAASAERLYEESARRYPEGDASAREKLKRLKGQLNEKTPKVGK